MSICRECGGYEIPESYHTVGYFMEAPFICECEKKAEPESMKIHIGDDLDMTGLTFDKDDVISIELKYTIPEDVVVVEDLNGKKHEIPWNFTENPKFTMPFDGKILEVRMYGREDTFDLGPVYEKIFRF